jgi:hypothetical protein
MHAKMYFRKLEMKWILKFIIITCLLVSSYRAFAQQLQLNGYILSIETNTKIPLANILNLSTNQRFIGSRQGLIKVKTSPTDTITITAIGFEKLTLGVATLIPENNLDTIEIYMRPIAYQLKDVTFIYGNHKRDSIAQLAAEFLKSDPLMNNYDRILNRDQGSMMSPLTAMWNEYSKAGQDMKHFEEFMRHAELLKQVNVRYNKKSIKRATNLEDEYLDDFFLFCNINRAFVLNSSDYDLILAVRECADRFKKTKGIQ